jgi:hypothetical protein
VNPAAAVCKYCTYVSLFRTRTAWVDADHAETAPGLEPSRAVIVLLASAEGEIDLVVNPDRTML